MLRTYQFRLCPTKSQQATLNKTRELCRWVYNEVISIRKNSWKQEQKTVTRYDTIKMLPEWKYSKSELNKVYSQVLQEVCTRVDLAFNAFFRRVKAGEKPGYPRFRGYGRYDSFTYPQTGFRLVSNHLYLSKIGKLKIVLHRPIKGKIKTLTIRCSNLGNWYACFSCEINSNVLPQNNKAVGIDVGLASFATYSNGKKITNPRFFNKDEKKLAKIQRKHSKTEKGTSERKTRRRNIQHIYQRMSNRRKDFAHKLSRSIVNEYGIIALEKLNCTNMLKNKYLAKSISDAAWNQFAQYVQYKAEEAGRECVLVDPHNTSKKCSRCGTLVEKTLSVRIHDCPVCGLKIDRDLNAAINILALGLQCLGESPRNSVASAIRK